DGASDLFLLGGDVAGTVGGAAGILDLFAAFLDAALEAGDALADFTHQAGDLAATKEDQDHDGDQQQACRSDIVQHASSPNAGVAAPGGAVPWIQYIWRRVKPIKPQTPAAGTLFRGLRSVEMVLPPGGEHKAAIPAQREPERRAGPRQKDTRHGRLQDRAVVIHRQLDNRLIANETRAQHRAAGGNAVARGRQRAGAVAIEVHLQVLGADDDRDIGAVGEA